MKDSILNKFLALLRYLSKILYRMGGGENIMDELFDVGSWMPKQEPVIALKLKADLWFGDTFASAGDYIAKVEGSWTVIAAADWEASHTPA